MTIHDGRLYARMGSPVTRQARDEFRVHNELVGLDLSGAQGKLFFQVSASEDIEPKDAAWSFGGSPVVAAGRLYSVLTRTNPNTQTHVACFDVETGKLLWNRKICAELANSIDSHNFVTPDLLTLAENSIYYSTGVGAVAALNADDGTVRWVVTYERRKLETNSELSDYTRQGLTPCLFHQGILVVAPSDVDRIIAYDAENGLLKWTCMLPDRIRHLLGVANNNLILSGNLLWALDIESGEFSWPIRRVGIDGPAGAGYGRGVLAGDYVFFPMRESIFQVRHDTGEIVRDIQIKQISGEFCGNLTIAGSHLLVAGPNRLVAFCELGLHRKPTRKEISANSNDEFLNRLLFTAPDHRSAVIVNQKPQ